VYVMKARRLVVARQLHQNSKAQRTKAAGGEH